MKRIGAISLLVAVIAVFGTIVQGEETASEVVERLQAQYDQTGDFTALFTHETIAKSLGAPAVMNGKIYIKKPGMMRWVYTDPKKQEIISDGETLWYYLPGDKQVRVYKAAEAFENLPFLNFLFGKGKVKDDFTASFSEPDMEKIKDSYPIILAPKAKDTSVDRIVILVSKKDYLVQQLNIYDLMGNVARFAFKDISVNSGLKDSMFHFIVPPGVEIVPIGDKTKPLPKPKVKIEIEENK